MGNLKQVIHNMIGDVLEQNLSDSDQQNALYSFIEANRDRLLKDNDAVRILMSKLTKEFKDSIVQAVATLEYLQSGIVITELVKGYKVYAERAIQSKKSKL